MKKIKILTVMGMFASAPLMAAEVDSIATTTPTVSTVKAFLKVSESQSLTEMQVGKLLDFASQLYRKKLKSLGFVRDLKQSVEQQCTEAKKYAKQMSGKLGISEDEFNTLFKETETLLRNSSINDADGTLNGILNICLRVPSKKIEDRLTDAGVDSFIQDVLGAVAMGSLELIASKVPANGCCGTVTHTLLDVLKANKKSHEPIA